jgi:hypothetical protein
MRMIPRTGVRVNVLRSFRVESCEKAPDGAGPDTPRVPRRGPDGRSDGGSDGRPSADSSRLAEQPLDGVEHAALELHPLEGVDLL